MKQRKERDSLSTKTKGTNNITFLGDVWKSSFELIKIAYNSHKFFLAYPNKFLGVTYFLAYPNKFLGDLFFSLFQ